MTLPPTSGIFAAVERRCADGDPTPPLCLFDGLQPSGTPLTPAQARRLLYDRSTCPETRTDLWRQIAERVHMDSDGRHDWPTAVLWLGLPGLRRAAFKITSRFGAEREDVEAELATCYLEALAAVDPHDADPGGTVLRSACTRAWTVWRTTYLERAVDDVDGAGGTPVAADGDDLWQADYDPPPGTHGLSATLRITVPAHRVEGVRLGALARVWGLADTAAGVGYSGRGRQVATLCLRHVGRAR
ncbi:hypothetical protein ACPCBC_00025 [Streptomyces incarnatus]